MEWYLDNKKFMTLALENCHVPLALRNTYTVCSPGEQSQFIHFFLTADLLGDVWGHLSLS